MATPLIPFVNIPPLHLFGPSQLGSLHIPELSIKPFGTLVAIGVFAGTELLQRNGKRFGLELDRLSTFVFYTLVGGFVGGHVFDVLFYHPDVLQERPWSILYIWESQSSFGGFTGAFIGLLLFWRKFPGPILPYADVVASGFPLGWIFGRMGCTVAHDHKGIFSNAWIAVAYPEGGRFDLGFLEMLFTIPLAAAFIYLARKPRPPGFFIGIMCMAYAPVRFAFDFLRVPEGTANADGDLRYGTLTPAQWGCFVLLATGVYFTMRAARSIDRGDGEMKPPPTGSAPRLPSSPPPLDIAAGSTVPTEGTSSSSG